MQRRVKNLREALDHADGLLQGWDGEPEALQEFVEPLSAGVGAAGLALTGVAGAGIFKLVGKAARGMRSAILGVREFLGGKQVKLNAEARRKVGKGVMALRVAMRQTDKQLNMLKVDDTAEEIVGKLSNVVMRLNAATAIAMSAMESVSSVATKQAKGGVGVTESLRPYTEAGFQQQTGMSARRTAMGPPGEGFPRLNRRGPGRTKNAMAGTGPNSKIAKTLSPEERAAREMSRASQDIQDMKDMLTWQTGQQLGAAEDALARANEATKEAKKKQREIERLKKKEFEEIQRRRDREAAAIRASQQRG